MHKKSSASRRKKKKYWLHVLPLSYRSRVAKVFEFF